MSLARIAIAGWALLLLVLGGVAAAQDAGWPSDPFPAAPLPLEWMAQAPAPRDDTQTPGGGPTSTEPTGPARQESQTPAPAPTAGEAKAAEDKSKCTLEKEKALEAAAATAYKGEFYDNQFGYLSDPCYSGWHLGESLKRQPLAGIGTLDVGGEYRMRYHHENNIRGQGLTGLDDDFLLERTRLYGNVELGDRFRFYAEMIDAVSNFEDFAPRRTEEDRADLLNLFGDYMIYDSGNGKLWGRAGRQELLYGAQRVISPADWSNVRRTFDGYKLFWRGDDWDVDAFWVRPVPIQRERFDTPDQSQQFSGIYSTFKGIEKQKTDLYFLYYAEDDAPVTFHFNTAGTRWEAEHDAWLAEIEAAYQFGEYGTDSHSAGMFTLGAGRKLQRLGWQPVLWAYYDWASGDEEIGNGYHHLFPLSHRYLGFMDLYGRRNIQDVNFLLTVKPQDKLTLLAWWHLFYLQNRNDVPYSVTMTPEVPLAGGSRELGQELDLLADYNLTARQNLIFGYCHFFAGDFYATNPSPPPFDGDADFFYTQYTLRF